MLNPKDVNNFYIQSTPESVQNDLELSPDIISDSPQEETDGIEILVQMAKQGKIDPWNIDIADIANKYMLHLAENKSNNLRTSSRALFFLAVLLKLKSNVLVGLDASEFEVHSESDEQSEYDDISPDEDMYYQDFPDNVIPINDIIQRRTSVKLNRNRIVTLKDLIRQLEFYEELDRKQKLKNSLDRAKRRVRSYKNLSTDDIINLAQEEYIESGMKILYENLENIFKKEEKVELKTLTLLGLDEVTAYISLLFLTEESDFEIRQEKFYSDLYVVKGAPKTEAQSETA